MEEDGLRKMQIQTDVELRLRTAGIRVLSVEDWLKVKGEPYLYIRFFGVSTKEGLYSYSLAVELRQKVILERNPSIAAIAPTWSVGSIGYRDRLELRQIRAFVADQVDQFANAYLSVNPRPETR